MSYKPVPQVSSKKMSYNRNFNKRLQTQRIEIGHLENPKTDRECQDTQKYPIYTQKQVSNEPALNHNMKEIKKLP